jgi:hypothetical protein
MDVSVLSLVALATWVVTALGGFYLIGTWIARGGARPGGTSRFPAALPFGHFLLAAAGLVVWIVYIFADLTALAWAAFVILLPVALLGFVMFFRWLPSYRARAAAAPAEGERPAEQSFPVPVVVAHGLLAVVTLVLVLLTALGVGES